MTDYCKFDLRDDGVIVVTMDAPGQSANTMDEAFREGFRRAIDELERRKGEYRGIVLTSAKKTFFAGGDLGFMMRATPADAAEINDLLNGVKLQLRRLERIGVPVVAAINGAALGGGYEIALAAHHRIVVDHPSAKVGLPEVTFGLLPGGGGTVRTVRMFGIHRALELLLLSGRQFSPSVALSEGLVDDVVADRSELIDRAVAWIEANPEASQPWDRDGYAIPGGTPGDVHLAPLLSSLASTVRRRSKGSPAPAARNIISAAVEGAQVDFDNASLIESRYCTELICSQISANLIKSKFFDTQTIAKGVNRPADVAPFEGTVLGIVGAGMMGSAIAFVAAQAGYTVVLRDVALVSAERGKDYARTRLDRSVQRGATTAEARDAVLDRITPTAQLADLAHADLVVEAVFEDLDLKRSVFRELQAIVRPETILASNTSTLPITEIAAAVSDPSRVIGMHFFSPVDKMPLVEIISGAQTGDVALAAALDVATKMRKVPIVVNDSPGFFTTRVIVTYLLEAIALLAEGVPPTRIEQAALQAGYPVGPLALVDELTLTLLRTIHEQTSARAEGGAHPAIPLLDALIAAGRTGRAAGGGFYDYSGGTRGGFWEQLPSLTATTADVALVDMQDRMLFVESIDSVRCLDEGVLRSVADANVGSLLGIGFPEWTGGVLQFISQYDGGVEGFVARADELAAAHGPRFAVPASLRERAAEQRVYV